MVPVKKRWTGRFLPIRAPEWVMGNLEGTLPRDAALNRAEGMWGRRILSG